MRRLHLPLLAAALLGGCGVPPTSSLQQRPDWSGAHGAAARQVPRRIEGHDRRLDRLLPTPSEVGYGFAVANAEALGARFHEQFDEFRTSCPAAGMVAAASRPSDRAAVRRQTYSDATGRWVSVSLARAGGALTSASVDAVLAASRWCDFAFAGARGYRYRTRWTAHRLDPAWGVGIEVRQRLLIDGGPTDPPVHASLVEVTIVQRRLDAVVVVQGLGSEPGQDATSGWPAELPDELVRRLAAQVDRRLARLQRAG